MLRNLLIADPVPLKSSPSVQRSGVAGSVANFLEGVQERMWRRRARRRRDAKLRLTAQFLALLIVVVGILDVISTNASLAAGGTETNALILSFMTELGEYWYVPKLAIHLIVAAFLMWLPSRQLVWKARVCIAIYTVIIAVNFYVAEVAVI